MKISVADALEALDSLDDYARMDVGINAHGPRNLLERFIKENVPRNERNMLCDPTGPGYDVEILRNHVRILERRIRDLHAIIAGYQH